MLHPRHRRLLESLPPPVIGVHVRHGDFHPLPPNTVFQGGGCRTPLDYFVERIEGIRQLHGSQLPVTVFSDGHDDSLADLLRLPAVKRDPPNAAIVDLLQLSRSQVILSSAGSSFSYWAIFLSDVPGLHHPVDQMDRMTRPDAVLRKVFEGSVSGPCTEWPALLRENLRNIAPPASR
jgi:hypothetical protein